VDNLKERYHFQDINGKNNNISIDPMGGGGRNMRYPGLDLFFTEYEPMQGFCEDGNELQNSIKWAQLLYWTKNYYLPKKDSPPCG
jgi:hypothetical protein